VTSRSLSRGLASGGDAPFITEAIFLAAHPSGTPEWHELRSSGIGGSEVAIICGLSKWESAFTLWAKKTGRIEESFAGSEAMEWGNRLEPVIIDKFAECHPEFNVYRDVGTWHHPDREWQRANPDGIFWNGDELGIIEVKTSQFEDDWRDGVPRYYEAQVQWYLQVFGYNRAFVVALFHGNKYAEFEVLASPFVQETNLQTVTLFREALEQDQAPDYDGSTSTLQTVRSLHPQIHQDAEEELGWLGVEYFAALANVADAESKLNELKSRVMAAMGNAKRGLVDGDWVLTRQAKAGGTPYLIQKRG
jgi:hypothetical protein